MEKKKRIETCRGISILNSQFSILNSQFSTLIRYVEKKRELRPVGESQFSILNSQFSILNSQFSTLNSQLSILNSQFSIHNKSAGGGGLWCGEGDEVDACREVSGGERGGFALGGDKCVQTALGVAQGDAAG